MNPGHVHPFLGLASQLAGAGHEIAIYAERYAAALVRQAGGELIAAEPVGDFETRSRSHAALVKGATAVARRTARHLLAVLERRLFDVVVVDHMHLGAALAAEKSGQRWATLSTSPVLTNPSFTAWPTAIPTAALRRQLGLPPREDNSLSQAVSPELLILPWLPDFDLHPPPAQAVHVGPLGAGESPERRSRPPGLPRGRGPIALVSVSTSPHRDLRAPLSRFLRLAATRIAELRYRAIFTVGQLDPAGLPRAPGLRYVRYADHARLMSSIDLVVTHGGWGTIGNALVAGRPLLVVPFERDQFANAALCARLGLGLAVDPRTVTADELGAAMTALLAPRSDAAARAAAIGRELRRRPPARSAAAAVLALGRRRRGPAARAPRRGRATG